MPQVLPGSTGGSRLRARSGGMSVHVATSPAFPPVIVPSVRLGDAASRVRAHPSLVLPCLRILSRCWSGPASRGYGRAHVRRQVRASGEACQ